MTTTRPPVVAIIPARGGSKGIPLKNLQEVAGRSLLARAIDAALDAQHIDTASLDSAITRVLDGSADVVFSAVEDPSFLWHLDEADHAVAVGHDAAHRPRRQDRTPQYNESGAFYVMRTDGFRAAGHRFSGRVGIEEVPLEQSREVDSMSDLTLVRAIAAAQEDVRVIDVDALVTDFDGVHTDDSAFVDEDGHEFVRVHRGDGMGVGRLVDAGFPFLVLSKERNPVVSRRAEKLRVDVLQGVDDKAAALMQWIEARELDPDRVAYVGNDINDLAAFSVVGWPIAVADAHPRVLAAARLVLTHRGGQGAVREVCDLIPDSALTRPARASASSVTSADQ